MKIDLDQLIPTHPARLVLQHLVHREKQSALDQRAREVQLLDEGRQELEAELAVAKAEVERVKSLLALRKVENTRAKRELEELKSSVSSSETAMSLEQQDYLRRDIDKAGGSIELLVRQHTVAHLREVATRLGLDLPSLGVDLDEMAASVAPDGVDPDDAQEG